MTQVAPAITARRPIARHDTPRQDWASKGNRPRIRPSRTRPRMHAKALKRDETDDYPARIGQVFAAELTERSRAPRHGALCFGCKEPPASQFAQCSEEICLPGSPRRAGAPAGATALSDWLFSP